MGKLRSALEQAYDLSLRGVSPGPIVRAPNDEFVIDAEQIFRLWKRLGIRSAA